MADLAPRPGETSRARSAVELMLVIALSFLFASVIPLVFVVGVDPLRVVGGLLALVGAMGVVSAAIGRASARRFKPANDEGLSALARGELDRAARIYGSWTRRGVSVVRCLARHNLAAVRARQGDLRGAIALLVDNENRVLRGGLGGPSAAQLTALLGLAGELDLADAWRAEADRRLGDSGPGRATAAFARAVVDCRRGNADKAVRELAAVWPDVEGHLRGADVRPVKIVRAFAAAQVNGPREAGVPATLLEDVRPRFAGEHDWLGAGWPEMRAFLVVNGLSAAG